MTQIQTGTGVLVKRRRNTEETWRRRPRDDAGRSDRCVYKPGNTVELEEVARTHPGGPPEGGRPCPHLILDFWPPDRERPSVLLEASVCGAWLRWHQDPMGLRAGIAELSRALSWRVHLCGRLSFFPTVGLLSKTVLPAHQRWAADPGVRADSEAHLAHSSSVTPTNPSVRVGKSGSSPLRMCPKDGRVCVCGRWGGAAALTGLEGGSRVRGRSHHVGVLVPPSWQVRRRPASVRRSQKWGGLAGTYCSICLGAGSDLHPVR